MVLKLAPPNQSPFCKILHFPFEAILLKKARVSHKDCCNTSRSNLGYNEEIPSNKVTYISQRGILSCFKQYCISQAQPHLEKKCNYKKIQKECCNTSRNSVISNEEGFCKKSERSSILCQTVVHWHLWGMEPHLHMPPVI